jgi:hypothetical protein
VIGSGRKNLFVVTVALLAFRNAFATTQEACNGPLAAITSFLVVITAHVW